MPLSKPPRDVVPLELLRDLPVGVFHSTNERVDFVNEAFARMYGVAAADLIGRDVFEALAPVDRDAVERRYRARLRGGAEPERYEIDARRADGNLLRVEIEPRVVGEHRLLVVTRDVTGRVRDTTLLAALAEIALRVQRCRTVDQVLEVSSRGLNDLGIHVTVARLEGPLVFYRYVALARGFGRALDQALGRPVADHGFRVEDLPLIAEVARDRRAIFRDDAKPFLLTVFRAIRPDLDEAAMEARLAASGLSTCVVCPLMIDGELWGFWGAAAPSFTTADAAALGLFASQVATALESAGVIERLEHRNRELAAVQEVAAAGSVTGFEQLLDQLLGVASAALSCEAAAIYLLDEKGSLLELAAATAQGRAVAERYPSFPLDVVSVHQTLVKLCAVAIDAALDLGSQHALIVAGGGQRYLSVVPLHIKGRLAGSLVLGRASRPFSCEELSTCDLLATQMAIQIENARLYADASRRLRLLTTLFELSQIGTGTLEVRTLVDRVLKQAVAALSVDGGAIHVLRDGRLHLAGLHGEVPHSMDEIGEVPCDATSPAGRAVLERRTQYFDQAYWRAHPEQAARGACFAAMVPLISKDRPQGTLTVARRDGRCFDAEETGLLEALAAQIAAALDQARSFEEERRRVEDFKLIVEVGRVVTASLDLDTILAVSAASLARIAEAHTAHILLLDPGRRVLRGAATSTPGQAEDFRSVRISLDEPSVACTAVLTNSAVRVPDVARAGLRRTDLIGRHGTKSLLVLPLAVRDQPIGAVVIGDSVGARDWTDAQLERATVVARQVAVAVANARLYEDLKKSYDQLAHAQEELLKRERLAALGELSAVVAHEVRNPLGVVFNSLRSLRRVLHPQGDAAMLLDIIGEEADRLNRIVGDLLDFARPSEPALQPEPLGAVLSSVAQAASSVATAGGVKIQVVAPEPLPQAAVDARMLRQALLNLVINAVQAMPRGGTVTLLAGEENRGGLPQARIEVSDTGPGIPPELAERVFQPFFTTKAAGTGLGLAVVKRIVEAHRGEVALESTPGKGARFTLWLPLTAR